MSGNGWGRFTPKRSVEALRQKWMAQKIDDPRLNDTGRILVKAANDGPDRPPAQVLQS